MIRHEFYCSVGANAAEPSEIRFKAVMESLHGAEGAVRGPRIS